MKNRPKKRRLPAGWHLADAALPVFVAAALILGGATAAGVFANLILQLAAIAVVAMHFVRRPDPALPRTPVPKGLRIIIAIAFAWPLIQLIPLPPFLWHLVPGREAIAANDALIGMGPVWRPLSLQPNQTIAALFAMLVPLAALLLTLKASDNSRWSAIGTILAVALVSSLLGIIQIAEGPGGQSYLYEITNDNTSVGFFANSNHLATLFLIAAACALTFPPAGGKRTKLFVRLARWSLLAFFLLNVIVNRSLAGYAIALLLAVYVAGRSVFALDGRIKPFAIGGGVVALLGIVGFFVSRAGRALIQTITLNSTDPSLRLTFYRNTLGMFHDSFPVGTGLGSFRWVYAGHEKLSAVTNVYANHAHNDYLETASDLGIVGPLLVIAFAIWFVATLLKSRGMPRYVESAAVAIVVIALHSLVDYPARTAAIASVAAMCIALMVRRQPAESDPSETPLLANAAT